MAVVVFNQTAFLARYPEFNAYAAANPSGLAAVFADTGLYLSNTDNSPVQDLANRQSLLWMITAHLAALGGTLSIDGQAKPVGVLTSASQGSVSITLNPGSVAGSAGWWKQTPYGANFWQATINLRGARYVPGPPPQLNGIYGPYGWFGRRW